MSDTQLVVPLARPCTREGCGGTLMPDNHASFDWGNGSAIVDTRCTRCNIQSMATFTWNAPDDLGEQCMKCGTYFDAVPEDDDDTLCPTCRAVDTPLLEARCSKCGDTFTPADMDDLTHAECGGDGVLSGFGLRP